MSEYPCEGDEFAVGFVLGEYGDVLDHHRSTGQRSVIGSDDQHQSAGNAVDDDEFVKFAVYLAVVVERRLTLHRQVVEAGGGPYEGMDLSFQRLFQGVRQVTVLTGPSVQETERSRFGHRLVR
jgi:hypothetical protein